MSLAYMMSAELTRLRHTILKWRSGAKLTNCTFIVKHLHTSRTVQKSPERTFTPGSAETGQNRVLQQISILRAASTYRIHERD